MLRRLIVVLCLALGGLTTATPALAQKNQAEFNLLRDNMLAAGRPSMEALTAGSDLLALLMEGGGQANTVELTPAWVADWNAKVDARIAALEATLPRLRQMTPAEIQRLSLGYAMQTKGLNRVNRIRAGLLDSSRQAIFFARECQSQATKAASGDEKARLRMIRISISSNRLIAEAQIVTLEGASDDMPDNQPQKPLGLASLSNDRASVEVLRLLERIHAEEPLDMAGTARRMREHLAEARRQAGLIVPAMNIQLGLMKAPGTPPEISRTISAVLVTYRASADTELRIASLLEATAAKIAAQEDAGDDAWGLDLAAALVEKRVNDHAARVKMIQDM